MNHPQAVVLIWIGGLGLAEFGGLWLAVAYLDRDLFGQITQARLGAIVGHRRRRRIDRWVRIAPLLTAVSIGLIVTGTIVRWAGAW